MKRPLCYPNTLEPGYDPSQKAAHIYYKKKPYLVEKSTAEIAANK